MVHTEFFLGVASSLFASGVLALIAKSRTRIRLGDERRRIAFLNESQTPDFFEKRQREIWIHIGVALYALGCYMLLSNGFPKIAIVLWRITAGLTVLWCGAKVMSNAAVINEYGVRLRREQIDKQQRIALGTKS